MGMRQAVAQAKRVAAAFVNPVARSDPQLFLFGIQGAVRIVDLRGTEPPGMVRADVVVENGIVGTDVDPLAAVAAEGTHGHRFLPEIERCAVVAVESVIGVEPYSSQPVLIDRENRTVGKRFEPVHADKPERRCLQGPGDQA